MDAKTKNLIKKVAFLSCAALLAVLLIVSTVLVGMFDSILTVLYSGVDLDSSARAEGEALALQVEEEGIVLVKNDENCLPLKETDIVTEGEHRLNVFGWAVTDWLMGGSGSGRSIDNTNSNKATQLKPNTDLLKALTNYKVFSDDGVKYNTALIDMYKDFKDGRNAASYDTLHSYDYNSCVLFEPQFSAYSSTLKDDAKTYSEVAIVVLGRIAGESNDAPKTQYKINTKGGKRIDVEDKTYLDISSEEEELLEYVGSTFKKVIVVINSTNTMNLEFMDRIKGLDACLVVGGTGNNGANAIPNVLFGKKVVKVEEKDDKGNPKLDKDGKVIYQKNADGTDKTQIQSVSPSGRLVDTYAYDFKTNPNFAYSGIDGTTLYKNAGSKIYPNTTTNPNVVPDGQPKPKYPGVSYLDYAESIYVGYKWYETADAEKYWDATQYNLESLYGTGHKGYYGVVQYPFGYGLSYSKFELYVGQWTEKDGKISVSVKVQNVGTVDAQEVVQLYFTPPYNKDGGIEKSAVNLCAFAKTHVLKPNTTAEIELSFDIQDMASYSTKEDDGAFVLESGNYNISIRSNSHTIATVKAGKATYTYNNSKKVVYNDYYGTNGTQKIKNLFSGENVSDGISVDGSDTEAGIEQVWLSRADFKGTFKEQKLAARTWNDKLVTNNLFTSDSANAWDKAWVDEYQAEFGQTPSYKQGQAKQYTLYNKAESKFTDDAYIFGDPKNYDSEEWETLLNQLTLDEMQKLVLHGFVKENELATIGKPKTISYDGPSQIGSFNAVKAGTGYPMPVVLAQTFNKKLANTYGLSVGTETKKVGYNGWYAPGVNLHRSAFGGRNYEYYSEDSYLSGIMCAETIRGALNAGTYTYIKHLIGYDQESYRDGLYCWMTEQALRETYLSPYKRAVDAGATGIMTSYGRLGSMWSGGSKSLLTDLLRKEWGYKGTVLTDYSDHMDFMNGDQMIRAGGDLWMDHWDDSGKFAMSTTSLAFKAKLRLASKHVIYTWANAAFEYKNYVADSGSAVEVTQKTQVFRWWWLAVAGADVLFAGGAAVLILLAFLKPKKNSQAVEAQAAQDTTIVDNSTSTGENKTE